MTTLTIAIHHIIANDKTQQRVATEKLHWERMQERILELREIGEEIDPIDVMRATDKENDINDSYYLIDGFHRLDAYIALGDTSVKCNVVGEGTERDAILSSLSSNATHKLALARRKGDITKACRVAARLLCDQQEANGTEKHLIRLQSASIAELCGLPADNSMAKRIAAEFNKEAKAVRDERISELLSEGNSNRETARTLGIPESTVRNAIRKTVEPVPFDPSVFDSPPAELTTEPKAKKEYKPRSQEDNFLRDITLTQYNYKLTNAFSTLLLTDFTPEDLAESWKNSLSRSRLKKFKQALPRIKEAVRLFEAK
ncbi:ParB N-terminal domain-containing protein [Endozoicomonas sp. 4G]|uniref:ParB N-terminal domain-containing protein n=1 Tax=Endozoicomonas sp. 4G TaxID=2872754 RepID=UPI0020784FAA|nr:ParB N-terminal domain-containing protein [Endozoicomonas sp. 4G]